LLCCTWGAGGAAALELGSGSYVGIPAYVADSRPVVEGRPLGFGVLTGSSTIGAGDTFIAGMLYGLMWHGGDWDLSRKVEFANELAGRKVVQDGFSGLGRLMEHAL
jgi:ketohexokinase